MAPEARVAIYYAPATDDPLWTAGNTWLGRDPDTNAPLPQPALPGMADITAEARGYGFHATLKPPMRLAPGRSWAALEQAAEAMAARIAPFDLPPLAVSDVHGFLALRETSFCAPLQALADTCVETLDPFRAPPTDAELARRRRSQLTAEQATMLDRWGYPYVFGTWFFHMTLTRRVTAEEKAVFMPAAERYFAAPLAMTRRVTDICLYTQAGAGSPFVIARRIPLRG